MNRFIVENETVLSLKNKLLKRKSVIFSKAKKELHKNCINLYYEILDDIADIESPPNKTVFEIYLLTIDKYIEKMSSVYREPTFDLGCSIALKEIGGDVFCILNSESKEIKEYVVKNLNAFEFIYSPNIERPDSTTKVEWNRMVSKWDMLFGNNRTLSDAGFEEFELVNNVDLLKSIDLKDIDLSKMSYKKRHDKYVKAKQVELAFENGDKQKEKANGDYNPATMKRYISICRDCKNGKHLEEKNFASIFFEEKHKVVSKENYLTAKPIPSCLKSKK